MNDLQEFRPFAKIARLSREIIVTEKLDGTNAQACVFDRCAVEDGEEIADPPEGDHWLYLGEGLYIAAGSKNRWIKPGDDNYGFARWVWDHAEQLVYLGHGQHFGEWWGQGIQRNYGLKEKRWSLFNVSRWITSDRPECCDVVPILMKAEFDTAEIEGSLNWLRENGSLAAPGFMKPEGIVIFHTHSGQLFKKTLEHDEVPKSLVREAA